MKLLPIKLWERSVDPNLVPLVQLVVKVNDSLVTATNPTSGLVEIPIDPVTPGTRVSVAMTIVSPDRATVVEQWEQLFRVARDASLEPDPTGPTLPVWARRLHPRLSWAVTATDPGKFIQLNVDLTFLEVTKSVNNSKYQDEYNPPWLFDPKNPYRDNPHHGCTFHVLELTSAPVPKTWMVVVPPPLDTSRFNDFRPRGHWHSRGDDRAHSSFDILVFYRPAIPQGTYSKTADAMVRGRLQRYVIDPPVDGPFFVRSPDTTPRWASWDANSNNGFEQQLMRSGKRILLIYPWPSGGNYGEAITASLPGLLQHLLICLHANGAIAEAVASGVQLDRLTLAGFSFGANRAVESWYSNRNRTDELYLMDAVENRSDPIFTRFLRDTDLIRSWLQQDARSGKNRKKKLRMIGGLSQKRMLALANQLDPRWLSLLVASKPSNVWVRPTHEAFWKGNGTDEIYSRAQLPPATPGELKDPKDPLSFKESPERFSTVAERGASTISRLSLDSWLFVRDEPTPTTVHLEVWEPRAAKTRLAELSLPVSHCEVAGFVRSFWLMDKNSGHVGEAITTAALAALLIQFVQSRIITGIGHNLRHQWTLVGGEVDPSRSEKFLGHLLLCLRDSNFD